MTNSTSDTGKESRAKRGRQKIIGDQLKRIYDEVTREPVPDDFLQLLERADREMAGKKKNKSDGDVR